MDIFIEFGIYTVYIYSIILFFCLVNVSYISFAAIGIYAYVFTIWVFKFGNCKMYKDFLYINSAIYAFFCVTVCAASHLIYNKFNFFRYILLAAPFGYFILIKSMENVYQCDFFTTARFITTTVKKFQLRLVS